MHHFIDGYKFAYNDEGDIIFTGNDETYVGVVYKNLTLNSVLDLEANKYANNTQIYIKYACPMNIRYNQILHQQHQIENKYSMLIDISRSKYIVTTCKKINVNYNRNRKLYHSNKLYNQFNKLHKIRERNIQNKRYEKFHIQLYESVNNIYDICYICNNNTCNYTFHCINNDKSNEIYKEHYHIICNICKETRICSLCNTIIDTINNIPIHGEYIIKHIYENTSRVTYNFTGNIYHIYNEHIKYVSCESCTKLFLHCNYCNVKILSTNCNNNNRLCNECYMYIIPE